MAKHNSKRSAAFGTGVSDGIFAPEVANNASIGGAIIPTIARGIPGDGTTALLLGGQPSTPFLLAFILGANLELNLRKGVTYARGSFALFVTRPVSAIFLIVAVLSVLWPVLKDRVPMLNKASTAAEFIDSEE